MSPQISWVPRGMMNHKHDKHTADQSGNSISVIDLGTRQVRTVPVRITPHNVQLSRDVRLLFAVGVSAGESGDHSGAGSSGGEGGGHGGQGAGGGRLLIFDAATMSTEGAADIEIGDHPGHVVEAAPSSLTSLTTRFLS